MAKWMKVDVAIPKRFGPTERLAIAQEVIDFIVTRTRAGKDIDGAAFPKYSQSYKGSLDFKIAGKGSRVDLTLTGEMLDSIKLISHSSGRVTVGFDRSDSKLNGKAEGNQLGTYGSDTPNPKKARPFLGINKDDLQKIIKRYPQDRADSVSRAKEELAAASAAGDLVDGIEFSDE